MSLNSLLRREYGLGNRRASFLRESEKKLHSKLSFAPCYHSVHSSTINHFDMNFSDELLVIIVSHFNVEVSNENSLVLCNVIAKDRFV